MPLKSILSTKTLHKEHKALLTKANIQVTEYNAISIDFVDFDSEIIVENAIITSQNAAKAVIDNKVVIRNCFCVGEKTMAFLEEHGQNVSKMKLYASELANYIVKYHKNEAFVFFCGNLRQDTLPDALKEHNIGLKEIIVYNTQTEPQKIDGEFDAILFYSPSGVSSYLTDNQISNETIFCIGKTTAAALQEQTKNIVIPSSPTIENLLQSVVKYSKKS
ncbi:uroporphyrinogen-III synthase [Formosa agariphila KMM 3901]|uniref:Uroporphyrinogen-III synthase n=1 Tax=Formosa agariphila (strain DSM 15362 / KCTC 12365 / LMG 23005 / KMM 3901 / M-2Alg 35-1) TaxID=1347342 RepID=T2KSB7_FORAG|nr:uroporphyrinogen-III synthase [Formosa agariphila]CDF81139.1 uroporphyrinogen-III synthase [Formosa agariphila KMM 3901]